MTPVVASRSRVRLEKKLFSADASSRLHHRELEPTWTHWGAGAS